MKLAGRRKSKNVIDARYAPKTVATSVTTNRKTGRVTAKAATKTRRRPGY